MADAAVNGGGGRCAADAAVAAGEGGADADAVAVVVASVVVEVAEIAVRYDAGETRKKGRGSLYWLLDNS